MTKEQKQDFTVRITQANSTEMIVILYEMLLVYIEDATRVLDDNSSLDASGRQEFAEAIRKARACLSELMKSLDLRYDPAPALRGLYGYCFRCFAIASAREDRTALDDIRKVIEPVKEAYREIAGQNSAGPVMKNSQTIYAGLTYGRHNLTENLADQGLNRGMLV